MKTETVAQLRNIRISPRKIRLVVDLVRGMNALKAIEQLGFYRKDAALPIKKLIESGIANAAHNQQVKKETLILARATVDEGATLKRWMPRAMGRATPIRKRAAHVKIVLVGEAADKKETRNKLQETKKEEKADVKKEGKT